MLFRIDITKLKRRATTLIVLLVTACLISSSFPVSVLADINQEINYQGKLTDSGGTAVTDGTYSIVYKLYTVSSGGSAIWTETQSVTATSGLFSVMLGSVSSLAAVDFNQTLYLGVNVGGDGEMTPRKTIGSVPSAFTADKLDNLDSTDFILTSTTSLPSIWSLAGLGQIGSSTATTTFLGRLAVTGNSIVSGLFSAYQTITAPNFVATSTTASTFPYASTTAITVSGTASTTALIVSGTSQLGTVTSGTWNGSTLGIAYGGTGLTSTPSYGQLLLGNASSGYTLTATSSLGIAISDTTGTLAIARGGTATTTFATGGAVFSDGTKLTQDMSNFIWDDANNRLGIGTSSPAYSLAVDGTVAFQGTNFATTTIGNKNTYLTISHKILDGSLISDFKITLLSGKSNTNTVGDRDFLGVNNGLAILEDASLNVDPTLIFGAADIGSSGNEGFLTYATATEAFKFNKEVRILNDDNSKLTFGSTAGDVSSEISFATSSDSLYFTGASGGYYFDGSMAIVSDSLTSYMVFANAAGSTLAALGYATSTDQIQFLQAAGGYYFTNGNVGIGTSTPWGTLSVTNTGATPSFIVEDSTSPDATPFIIDASGNVGVGTSSPYLALSVAGKAVVTDNIISSYFTATSTTASTFPYASTTAITVSGTASTTALIVSGTSQLGTVTSGTWNGSTLGIAYGGTGLTSTPSYGQLLLGNASSGYTLTATSSLGIAISDTTGTLAIARGGTGATSLTDLITLGTHTSGNYVATLANASNGGLTVSNSGSETAAVTVGLDLTNSNTWTGLQKFYGSASSTLLSANSAYFGSTATSSFSSTGALTLASALGVSSGGTGLTSFGGTNTLLYTSSANTLSSISTANTSALVTNSSGVPAWTSGSTANRLLRTDGTTVSFAQVALATDVSGTLPIGNGGTGITSFTPGDMIYASGATTLTKLASSTGGTILQTSFTTGAPSWVATSSLGIAISDTTGTLAIARGGTGTTTAPAGGVTFSDGTKLTSDPSRFNWSTTYRTLGIGTQADATAMLVVMGTTTDDTGYSLVGGDGNGNILFGVRNDGTSLFLGNQIILNDSNPIITFGDSTGAVTSSFQFATSTDQFQFLNASGGYYFDDKLGIATTSPVTNLSVVGAGGQIYGTIMTSDGSTSYTQLDPNFGLTLRRAGGYINNNYVGGSIVFRVSNSTIQDTTALTISSTGNVEIPYASTTAISSSGSAYFATSGGKVGIGTTTPARTLTIAQSSTRGSLLLIDQAAGFVDSAAQGGTYLSSEQGKFGIAGNNSQGSGTAQFLTVDQVNGRVGISSTTPWKTFSVTGSVAFSPASLTTNTGAATYSLCLSSVGEMTKNTDAETCIASSIRYKKNVEDLTTGLNELLQLRPVTFEYKETDNGEHLGFIAEEVQQISPLLSSYDEQGLPNGIRWSHVTTLLVKSVQQQQSEIAWIASSTPWLSGLNIGDPVDSTQLGFGDKTLINVKAITSASGNWSISEDGILVVKEVHADKLCLGSTCVNETQLQQLLNTGGSGSTNNSGGGSSGSTSGSGDTGSSTPDNPPVGGGDENPVADNPPPSGDPVPTDDSGSSSSPADNPPPSRDSVPSIDSGSSSPPADSPPSGI